MAVSSVDSGYSITHSARITPDVNYKDKSKQWLEVFKTNVDSALGAMADAIKAKADMTVPYKTGALRDSGRVEGRNLERTVTYGGNGIAYGAYQERGMRANGTHIVRNYTTSGTGAHYLENALTVVSKEGIKRYIK